MSHQQYDAAFRTDRVRSPYSKTGERSKHTSMRAEWFSNVHDLTAPLIERKPARFMKPGGPRSLLRIAKIPSTDAERCTAVRRR